jgi:hypothetical protein
MSQCVEELTYVPVTGSNPTACQTAQLVLSYVNSLPSGSSERNIDLLKWIFSGRILPRNGGTSDKDTPKAVCLGSVSC